MTRSDLPASGADTPPVAERYWVLDVLLPSASEELWSLFCYELGCTGAELLADTAQGPRRRYYFAVRPCADAKSVLRQFRAAYPDLAPPLEMILSARRSEDWASSWHAHFRPIPVGEGLLVCPPWEIPAGDGSGRRPLIVNPGQGFGTGAHASTWLALALLERRLARSPLPAAMLDVGTGSGILALAAALQGVPALWALDTDPVVMPEVLANFGLNGLPGRLRRVVGRPDCIAGVFPLVCANIVREVLLTYGRRLAGLTAPGGTLLLSGMLQGERDEMLDAYLALGMVLLEDASREHWWACTLQRPPA